MNDPADVVAETGSASRTSDEVMEDDTPLDFFDSILDRDFMDCLDVIDDDQSTVELNSSGANDMSISDASEDAKDPLEAPETPAPPPPPPPTITTKDSESGAAEESPKTLGKNVKIIKKEVKKTIKINLEYTKNKPKKSSKHAKTRDKPAEKSRDDAAVKHERRDPEKTRRDIQNHKLKCKKAEDRRILTERLDSGLCPPGMELDEEQKPNDKPDDRPVVKADGCPSNAKPPSEKSKSASKPSREKSKSATKPNKMQSPAKQQGTNRSRSRSRRSRSAGRTKKEFDRRPSPFRSRRRPSPIRRRSPLPSPPRRRRPSPPRRRSSPDRLSPVRRRQSPPKRPSGDKKRPRSRSPLRRTSGDRREKLEDFLDRMRQVYVDPKPYGEAAPVGPQFGEFQAPPHMPMPAEPVSRHNNLITVRDIVSAERTQDAVEERATTNGLLDLLSSNKISLSEYLFQNSKETTSLDDKRTRDEVLKQCEAAVNYLETGRRFAGKFGAGAGRPQAAHRPDDESPLVKANREQFAFCERPSDPPSDGQFARHIEHLRQAAVNLGKRRRTPSPSSGRLVTQGTQTDPVCIRYDVATCDVGTQAARETASAGVQADERDAPSQRVKSLAALTPAQILQQQQQAGRSRPGFGAYPMWNPNTGSPRPPPGMRGFN